MTRPVLMARLSQNLDVQVINITCPDIVSDAVRAIRKYREYIETLLGDALFPNNKTCTDCQ